MSTSSHPRSFAAATRLQRQEDFMITLRNATTYLLGIGSFLVVAGSCAASPLPGGGAPLRDRAAGYEVEVLVDGVPVPTFAHDNETYVLGQLGARYTLRISNHSGRRIEAVASVDGRDVIDGKPAEFRGKRGYLVPAWGQLDIDGWRISHAQAAAFRFSSVRDSYAARTGSAREVGVIGVAIFPERYLPPPPPPLRRPLPLRPRYDDYEYDYQYDRAPQSRSEPGGAADERSAARSSEAAAPPASPSASAGAGAGAGEDRRAKAGVGGLSRPGLGTEYGEAVSSPIYEVEFVRASGARPSAVIGLRYDDRDGLLAMGIDVDGPDWAFDREEQLRRTAEPFPATQQRRFASPPPGWRRTCCMR
jgi:hypothetical protein